MLGMAVTNRIWDYNRHFYNADYLGMAINDVTKALIF